MSQPKEAPLVYGKECGHVRCTTTIDMPIDQFLKLPPAAQIKYMPGAEQLNAIMPETGDGLMHVLTRSIPLVYAAAVANGGDVNLACGKAMGHATPLHAAATQGRLDMIDALLALGAKIDTQTASGMSPLMDCVVQNLPYCADVAQRLLERGANVHLRTHDKNFTALHLAVENKNPRVVRLLIRHGADRAALTTHGFTPLMRAMAKSSLETIEAVAEGCPKWIINMRLACNGHTALTMAVGVEIFDVIDMLMRHGARPDLVSVGDASALLQACRIKSTKILRRLLVSKPKVNMLQAEVHQNALHVASREGTTEAIELILDAGANINCRTGAHGWTPLCLAVGANLFEHALTLICRGADLSLAEDRGCSPLHIAVIGKNLELVYLLLAAGANPVQRAKDRAIPYDIARKHVLQMMASYAAAGVAAPLDEPAVSKIGTALLVAADALPPVDQLPDIVRASVAENRKAYTAVAAKLRAARKARTIQLSPGCSACGAECTDVCSGCGKTFYCSIACQNAHWKTHKTYCNK